MVELRVTITSHLRDGWIYHGLRVQRASRSTRRMDDYERVGVHRPPPLETSDDSGGGTGLDTDSDEEAAAARTSTDRRQHDRSIIEKEEEAEQLLAGQKVQNAGQAFFRRQDRDANQVRISNKERRRYKQEARRHRRGQEKGEESELMYEMEEGAHRDGSESSGNSSELDRRKLEEIRPQKVAYIQHLI